MVVVTEYNPTSGDGSGTTETVSNNKNSTVKQSSPSSNYTKTIFNAINFSGIKLAVFDNSYIQRLWALLGIIVGLLCGFAFAKYVQEMHEALYWFSHIKQVEREISLRTEAGFYYSYFKELVQPNNSFTAELNNLLHDLRTEYPREINALQRFNIYPEILLAFVYRSLSATSLLPAPILFYVYSCFMFSGFAVSVLFFIAWNLTGSWIYGLLAATWMTVNHLDSSRAFFTVNMRENFALPFFWLQNLALLEILKSPGATRKYSLLYGLSTLLFILCWQFNQFVLLLQSLALLSVVIIEGDMNRKVIVILCLQLTAAVLALILQFFPPFALTSISISFCISAILVLYFTERFLKKILSNFFVLNALMVLLIFGLTAAVNKFTRKIAAVEEDSHIWTFVKAKLGIRNESPVPFETAIYLCHRAFDWIDNGFFVRTKSTGVFPVYCIAVVIVVVVAFNFIFRRQPDQTSKRSNGLPITMFYLVVQSLLFGVLAILTMRMKYLWFPYIVIISAYSIYLLSRLSHRIPVTIIATAIAVGLLVQHYPVYRQEIQDEKEFWDPETVELMEWISRNTPKDSSWAGTMQLMAGVKACTGRKLVNHPHFEDKWLRNRTSRIYQIYGRQPINFVHNILRNEGADYIIVEESTCHTPSSGCSTKDLVDLENRIMPESADLFRSYASKLRISTEPRFCDRISYDNSEGRKYFQLAFYNDKFRIYEVLGV